MSMPSTPDVPASPRRPIEFDLTDEDSPPPVHTCTVCGTSGPWGPPWTWYGSWRDLDNNPSKIVKCCSAECRRQHSADNALDSGLVD